MAAAIDHFRPVKIWPAAVHAALARWGTWQARSAEHSGFATVSAIARLGELVRDPPGRDRILCRDMPAGVLRVHRAWLRLKPHYQEALWARYAMPVNADGTVMDGREVAAALGVPLHTYRTRLRRAKDMIGYELSTFGG
ncbi:MAG: hypothetical protein AMXMBFR8_26960 [Nevskiales bacterium]